MTPDLNPFDAVNSELRMRKIQKRGSQICLRLSPVYVTLLGCFAAHSSLLLFICKTQQHEFMNTRHLSATSCSEERLRSRTHLLAVP